MSPMRMWMVLMVAVCATLAACETAPKTAEDRSELESKAASTIQRFKDIDPSMSEKFFNTAKAWAVFPSIDKGGAGLGGAYGKGVLYEGGQIVGYCDMTQGTIGFQLGGQAYSQIIFFEDAQALKNFKSDTFEFSAQATGVAATKDAIANTNYDHGVAVFVYAAKGLMGEASVGGQDFEYVPKGATGK